MVNEGRRPRAGKVHRTSHGVTTNRTKQPGFCFLLAANPTSLPAVTPAPLPYRIAVLVFLEDAAGRHLLLLRAKPPNQGIWSPIGGKLETAIGESPHECAVRETREETGHVVTTADLHLFGLIAEKAYEGQSHWLLFLFRCQVPLSGLPPDIVEGKFGLFSRDEIDRLPIPETDRNALWPVYDQHRHGFVVMRADCGPGRRIDVTVEQTLQPKGN